MKQPESVGFFPDAKYEPKKIDKSTLGKQTVRHGEGNGDGLSERKRRRRKTARLIGDAPDTPLEYVGERVAYKRHEFEIKTRPNDTEYGEITATKVHPKDGFQMVNVLFEKKLSGGRIGRERQSFELKLVEVRTHLVYDM